MIPSEFLNDKLAKKSICGLIDINRDINVSTDRYGSINSPDKGEEKDNSCLNTLKIRTKDQQTMRQ